LLQIPYFLSRLNLKFISTPLIYTLSLHDALPILSTAEKIYAKTKALPEAAQAEVLSFVERLVSQSTPAASEAAGEDWLTSLSTRSEEHTSELQSRFDLVCRLLLEKKKSSTLDPFTTTLTNHPPNLPFQKIFLIIVRLSRRVFARHTRHTALTRI